MSIARSTTTVTGVSSSVTRRRAGLVLAFAFMGTLFDGAELNLVGYPMAYIATSLHVTTLQLVQVTTLQGFTSIAGGLVCGWLGDRFGRRWTYAGAVLVFGIGAILGGLAPTYGVFLLSRLLAGVGMGGLFGLAYSMFAESWKSDKRGTMGGWIQAMYFVGQMVTEGIVFFCTVQFGQSTGWRGGYLVIGAITVAVGVLAMVLLPESEQWRHYRQELKAGRVPERLRPARVPLTDLFRREHARGTILFVVLASSMFLTTNSLISYLTTYLVKVQGLPLGTASLIVLFSIIINGVTYPIAGALSDVITRKYAFFWCSLVGVVGFGWLLLLVTTGNAHVTMQFWTDQTFWAIMLCAGGSGGFGVLGVWMAEFFPTRIRSAGSNTSYYAGRGIGAGLFPLAALAIGGSVPMALALGVVGPVLGSLFALSVPDRTGRAIVAVE
jgi:SHS family lactate transporter-like MFS transporter